jgi:hypothetical protein
MRFGNESKAAGARRPRIIGSCSAAYFGWIRVGFPPEMFGALWWKKLLPAL